MPKEEIIPTPRYFEPLKLTLPLLESVRILISDGEPKLSIVARLLKEGIEDKVSMLRGRVQIGGDEAKINLHLIKAVPNAQDGLLRHLNILDRQVLSGENCDQAYVLRTLDEKNILIAGAPQGVLFGAMTLLQLLREEAGKPTIPGVYIRDFPSFKYRIAAGWLLNGEGNRWSLDRGQGLAAYEALFKRKLDRCLKHKINVVMCDGFGFGLKERFPEYPALMRRLNQYARERGIHLEFGGYGAGFGMSYQMGPLYEDAPYRGTTFYNRESYPNGPVYSCMGYNEDKVRKGVNAGELGTCRSNDELNRLKAKELADYVRAVEPGMIYIHNEDYGGYDTTQKWWLKRCPRCRQRWPNDEAWAADGAAGGLANTFSHLIEAIKSVKNRETGYDASRDTIVALASPLYSPSSPSSEDWHKALMHWQNIARALPPCTNLQIAFREVFPQTHGHVRWVDCFNRSMKDAGLHAGMWMYFLSGGDNWCNDNPFVATPTLDHLFYGAEAIYNANGSAYQEAQQLLNVECAWNIDSANAMLGAKVSEDSHKVWLELLQRDSAPESVFGEQGFLRRACTALYGEGAAASMARYYSEYTPLPNPELEAAATSQSDNSKVMEPTRGSKEYLPMTFSKVFGIPVHWRRLALDSRTWGDEVSNQRYIKHMKDINIDRAELHRRLKRFWEIVGAQSQKASGYLKEALAASPRPESREDLEFFLKSTEISVALGSALSCFHEALHLIQRNKSDRVKEILEQALSRAREVTAQANTAFPEVVDPEGGEVGSLRRNLAKLEPAIRHWQGRYVETLV